MLALSGRAGSSFDPDRGRCFIGGVAIFEYEAAEDREEERLSDLGEGGGSESSDAIAGEEGKGGTSDGRL